MDGIVRPPDGIAREINLLHLLCHGCQKYLALGACNILSDVVEKTMGIGVVAPFAGNTSEVFAPTTAAWRWPKRLFM